MNPPILPTPTLGDVTAIAITTPDLERSLQFYQGLGFTELFRNDIPFPWIQITDSSLLIMLRKDPNPFISLTYYAKELGKVAGELAEKGISFDIQPGTSDMIKRYVFRSPDGMAISLVTYVPGFHSPTGANLLSMPQQDFFNPDKYPNKICGLFGEFAHPVKELDVSISFWEKLGFTVLSKFASPYPWAIVTDGLAVVGLHQTIDFDYPVITYFAADMKDRIRRLKEGGLSNYTEKGQASIVLTTPEQQHINLFNMGM